ncbi:MAG: glutamate formiminotransferase / 5-formyltetrahydrofolate cyclo-ligase [Acidimicrobiaceae bacterium]|jgi:glutamate formiminotransferase
MPKVLECVMNVSEGHDGPALAAITAAAGDTLLDLHRDEHHNRAVLTLAGEDVEDAARAVAATAVDQLDLRTHTGVHPRIGVLDVVPFVPLAGSTIDDAIAVRDAFASWAGRELALPCFFYGPERSLPDIRRAAFTTLAPDTGPATPHPSAGACAVGARPILVAYNVWLVDGDLATAKAIAASLRSDHVRALGLQVDDHVQVSCNLLQPDRYGPAEAFDHVAAVATIAKAELVGLLPHVVLAAVAQERWAELDLSEERTIEARLPALRRSRH